MPREARVRTSLSFGATGMLLVNVMLSLLGWLVAYPRRSHKLGGVLVALHLLASASTLPNSPLLYPANGCVVAPQHGRLRRAWPSLAAARAATHGSRCSWAQAECPRRVGAKERPFAALWCLPNAADITFEHLQALPCLFATVAATGLLTAYLVSVSFARDFAVAPPRVAVVSKSRTR